MINYEDIRELHEAGKTAAEIAAAKTAEGVTVEDIDLGDLLYTLNFRGMLTKAVGNDSAKKWSGSILDMQAAVASDAAATLSVQQWLSHITNIRNTTWQTSKAEYASPFYALYQTFKDTSVFNAGDLDAVYALGGERIERTEEDVQSAIDAHERNEIITTCLTTIESVVLTAQTKLNNASANLGPEHVDGLTLAELQARCDAISASLDGSAGA